jgi:hypothetical protein
MRISFTPKSYGAVPSHGAGSRAGERFALLSDADEDEGEARLPAGWWILPYALFGLIECVFAINWIIARL